MNLNEENEQSNFREIAFGNRYFDLLLFLNGEFDEFEIIKKIPQIPIFAADGACLALLKNGIIPDFIIGDLDSFSIEDVISKGYPKEKIIKISDQETNDFEKTLKFAAELGYKNILILGIHGGLYEHSLNNWSVLSRYSKYMNLTIYDKGRYGFCIDFSFQLKTYKTEIISLIPKNKANIKTNNLAWKLDYEDLEFGVREGIRNISTSDNVSIMINSGEIFLFIDDRLPYAPEYI